MYNIIDYINEAMERLEQVDAKPEVVLLSPADKKEIEKSTVINKVLGTAKEAE